MATLTVTNDGLSHLDPDDHGENRRTNYRRRARARQLAYISETGSRDDDHGPLKRLKTCGLALGEPVTIKLHNGHAYAAGLRACGRLWTCPTCSARIRARRLQETEQALANHCATGAELGIMTLTIRHDNRMSLDDSINRINDAWASLQQRRQFRPLYLACTGTITTMEITYGTNGWHPHLHITLLAGPDQSYAQLVAATEQLRTLWSRLANHTKHNRFSIAHGLDLTWFGKDSATVAKYITKVAKEMTLANTKSTRDPFHLLDSDTPEATALYIEYATATAGRQCHRWSNGLRRLLLPKCPIDGCKRTDDHNHNDAELAKLNTTPGTDMITMEAAYWNSLTDRERLGWLEFFELEYALNPHNLNTS